MNRAGKMLCEEQLLFLLVLVVGFGASSTQTEIFMRVKINNITGEI